jgi:hypothetical protein
LVPIAARARLTRVVDDLAADGLAGLAILRSMQLTFVFYEFVATSAHVDALMISVERMLQYIEGIEQEPSQDKGDTGDLK